MAKHSKSHTKYTKEMALTICDMIASGQALFDVCQKKDMPGRRTVYGWLSEQDEFSHMYARAREERADLLADEIVAIADNEPDHNKARVRMDARKWWASKVNPKKYGERVVTENTHTVTIDDLLKSVDGKTRGLPTGS